MKKNKKIFIIIFVVIILIIVALIFIPFIGARTCKCDNTKLNPATYLKITNEGIVKETSLPKFNIIISGKKDIVLSNKNVNDVQISNYKVKSIINNTIDESTWLGIKLTDIFTKIDEDFSKGIRIRSSLMTVSKNITNIDNSYLLFLRNNEQISINEKSVAIIADFNVDGKYWLYDPAIISSIE